MAPSPNTWPPIVNTSEAGIAVSFAIASFTLIYCVILMIRVDSLKKRDRLEELKRRIGGES